MGASTWIRFWGTKPVNGAVASEGPDNEDDSDDEDDDANDRPESVIVQEGDPGSVRVRGQVERDRLKNNME